MGATRIALTMLCLLVLGRTASAQSVDIVVFGPDGNGKLQSSVRDVLAKARVGTASAKKLDNACTASTQCLVTAGAEAGARRALAVTVNGAKISFVIVDVVDKELIAKQDVKIAERKIARELDDALRSFIANAPTEHAKLLFAVGNRHYELGEYAMALEVYKKAYRVKPLPAFQFNIAQCHRKLNQHKEAIQMYQAYLVGVPNADNKALVESLIEESNNQIAAAQKAARDLEQAKLDTEKKKAEEARLAAEAARRASEAEANAEAERRKKARAQIERERELDKTYNRHPTRRWMIATGIIGAGAIGAGVYFGNRARNHQSAFDDAGCGQAEESLPKATLDKCRDDADNGRKDSRLANILMASGGAVVLGSLIVYIVDPGNIERPKRERATVTVAPNTDGISVQAVLRW